jgi:Na+/H+ antiporter NhaD/arsenite permease-like protein
MRRRARPASLAAVAVLVVGIFVVTYAFIASERVHRVVAALCWVTALAVIGVVDTQSAFSSSDTGVDWDVIALLFGMMVIVSVLKQTGVFDALALWAAQGPAAVRSDSWRCLSS